MSDKNKDKKKQNDKAKADAKRSAHWDASLLGGARLIKVQDAANDKIATYYVNAGTPQAQLRKDLVSQMPKEWADKLKV